MMHNAKRPAERTFAGRGASPASPGSRPDVQVKRTEALYGFMRAYRGVGRMSQMVSRVRTSWRHTCAGRYPAVESLWIPDQARDDVRTVNKLHQHLNKTGTNATSQTVRGYSYMKYGNGQTHVNKSYN